MTVKMTRREALIYLAMWIVIMALAGSYYLGPQILSQTIRP